MDTPDTSDLRPTPLARWLRLAVFLAAVPAAFLLPDLPSFGLDASWRMALGKFFVDGRQFGTEVVFTYGPLGWTMGNMYWGGQWASLLGWHFAQALVVAALVSWQAFRMPWARRVLFLLFLFFVGLRWEDIQQQLAMMLAGWELIRRADEGWRRSSVALVALLAVLSLVKFTNLLLAAALVLLAAGPALARRERRAALAAPAWFTALLLVAWLACGQNPLHLPAYLRESWEISSGYQDAMGWSCPAIQLQAGLVTAAALLGFLALNSRNPSARARGLAPSLAAAAYLLLNWKHGFVRADGHQLLFYGAALAVVAAAPRPNAGPRWRWTGHVLLALAALAALRGAELVAPGALRGAGAGFAAKLRQEAKLVSAPGATRAAYEGALESLRQEGAMPLTRRIAGDRTVDVLGFEQGTALFNGFHYVPRPVFQSYSAYTPRLAARNREHYLSARAPEFVLFKLNPIDGRLGAMDDALVLALLPERYTYLFTEKGFSVWRRKPDAPAGAPIHPDPVRTVRTRFGEHVELTDLRAKNVWVQIDFRLNALGRLRRLLFKPPLVQLAVTDETGATTRHRLPAPIGATGFLLSPVATDVGSFLRAVGGDSGRVITGIAVEVSAHDRDCFADAIIVAVATLPPHPGAGWAALPLGTPELPLTFVSGRAPFGAQLSLLPDGQLEYYAHAPSSLVYRAAPGARTVRGGFGVYASAYASTNANPTDGVEFIVRWHGDDGREEIVYRRVIRPRDTPGDRGTLTFRAPLPATAVAGTIEFAVDPAGHSSSDWAYWRDLTLENSP